MNSTDKESGYEEILKRLEEVIEALEAEGLDLDQSIKIYEEGAALYQKAQEMLSSREEKALEIINLLEETQPQMTLEDLKEE
ncbi:exodeoxyribonuclease VII small subunit [Isachenkonia alkalipeptolytica]|uniref:Exodeoxyribonuclease 7 small subunit n=1 Tax=Isachenkonia alkalipeptolytica TaxID=2565777 RepID=A0AA44BEB4_9CLOT|nr:exodeoxyribonuclease VII small subunit [Isachenkonia alkalipeptolytica]NBG88783.1 exodeoxyribonuclease VII small subunit [Isachenkonia alkalipeptolytica]